MRLSTKLLIAFCALLSLAPVSQANADTSFSFSVGNYYPDHGPRWRHHHHRPPHVTTFYAPPPVYYVPPPRRVIYETAPTYVVEPTLVADPSSPAFLDERGRTCRAYQYAGWDDGAPITIYGKACLYPDGSWRVVR